MLNFRSRKAITGEFPRGHSRIKPRSSNRSLARNNYDGSGYYRIRELRSCLGTLFFHFISSMIRPSDTPSDLKNSLVDAIEVRLWEIYLTRSRKNFYQILSSYSLDNGAYRKSTLAHDRVSFRFTLYDWKKSVIRLCQDGHIPFEITGTFTIDVRKHPIKKKVYVAEDDLNILFALNAMLEEAGYDVLLAHCGQPMMEPTLPATDLFILDKRMPGVDGIEICKHLKNQDYTRDIPVIMISASRNSASEAYAAGVNDFLEKPFSMKDLLKLVDKHTSASRSENMRVQHH